MSIQSVKQYFKENDLLLKIIETSEDTSTVEKAAKALGIEPDMIAKTLAFKLKEREILILTKGGAKTDNRKFKDYFKEKPKFVKFEAIMPIRDNVVSPVRNTVGHRHLSRRLTQQLYLLVSTISTENISRYVRHSSGFLTGHNPPGTPFHSH